MRGRFISFEKIREKMILFATLFTAFAQENTILPFSELRYSREGRSDLAEQERRLAIYILQNKKKESVSYNCYTDKSMGTKDFGDSDIQYQSCTAFIHIEKERYLVRIVNQNESRKNEYRLEPGFADYFIITRDGKLLGEDEFLDGNLEHGDYTAFPIALEKLLAFYES